MTRQALSTGVSRQGCWSGWLCPHSRGDFLGQGKSNPLVSYISCVGRWVLYHWCQLSGKPAGCSGPAGILGGAVCSSGEKAQPLPGVKTAAYAATASQPRRSACCLTNGDTGAPQKGITVAWRRSPRGIPGTRFLSRGTVYPLGFPWSERTAAARPPALRPCCTGLSEASTGLTPSSQRAGG